MIIKMKTSGRIDTDVNRSREFPLRPICLEITCCEMARRETTGLLPPKLATVKCGHIRRFHRYLRLTMYWVKHWKSSKRQRGTKQDVAFACSIFFISSNPWKKMHGENVLGAQSPKGCAGNLHIFLFAVTVAFEISAENECFLLRFLQTLFVPRKTLWKFRLVGCYRFAENFGHRICSLNTFFETYTILLYHGLFNYRSCLLTLWKCIQRKN